MKLITACGSAVVASVVTFSFARETRAQDTVQTTRTQPNRAMLGSGVFTFAVPYVSSVVVAASSDHPGDHNLYVPVAGPWMDLGARHCAAPGHCDDGLNKGLLVVDGIFQGLGALNVVGAFLFPETVTLTRTARRDVPNTSSVQVGASNVGSGYGVVALGAF